MSSNRKINSIYTKSYNLINSSNNTISIKSSNLIANNLDIILPPNKGGIDHVLQTDGFGNTSWTQIYGINGITGFYGFTGTIADNGFTGPNGQIGIDGIIGSTGITGLNGINDIAGPDGPTGPTGPTGNTGNNDLLGRTGPSGPTGPTGYTGNNGLLGITGRVGSSGPTGAMSDTGPTGPNGNIGPSGPNGFTGITGLSGLNGITGCTGIIGLTGPNGIIGVTGPTGPKGEIGIAGGPTGMTGIKGHTGELILTTESLVPPTINLINNSSGILKGITGMTGVTICDFPNYIQLCINDNYIELLNNIVYGSHINLTSVTPSFSYSGQHKKLTTDFTTISISNDWTNNGGGKFTYNGYPRIFHIYVRAKQSSSTSFFDCFLSLFRNDQCRINIGVFFTNITNPNDGDIYSIRESPVLLVIEKPIIINTNDFFYVYVDTAQPFMSGVSTNLQIDINIIT
jgi:hypothetical protein